MRYLLYLLPFTIVILGSCADQKGQSDENETVEIESDVVTGQERDELRVGYGSVTETVNDNETLHFLKDALHVTNLDSVLSVGGPYTLFAPSDDAFEALDPLGKNNLPADLDEEELKEILLHHVVKGDYRASALTDGQTLTTLAGDKIHITMQDDELTVDSASVVFSDREADNGYVHIIDQVLMPM